jgi:hypothetical protein
MQVTGFFHRKPWDSHFDGLGWLSWWMFFFPNIPMQKGMHWVVLFPCILGVAVQMSFRFLSCHTLYCLCNRFCGILLLMCCVCNYSLTGICPLSCV